MTAGRTNHTKFASAPKSAAPPRITLAQLAQAFQKWEEEYRAEPQEFLSADECAAASVSQLSADRAAYFSALLARLT